MASGYHLIVKKSFDRTQIDSLLPDHIQRGWNRIYTPEEQEFLKRSCILGRDVQIPNSVVRHRLGTTEILRKANIETLRKAFDLPHELFLNLSHEHSRSEMIEEEKLVFQWDDDEDELERKRRKSPIAIILDKQREKRRKREDYKYDYDHIEPLTIEEIVEEIRTNIGKDLKADEIKLITELMQIISRNKNDQIMDIYDELTAVQLIDKFGGIPKLVQALQEIQKAFEQVTMKTNVSSIETVIDILLEKDHTYRVAVELLKSFNENTKKHKLQQLLNLNDKSGDISEYDHTVFTILIKDHISRLPVTDLTTLIQDFKTISNIETSELSKDRDSQVKFFSEQLTLIFTRAHLDGIKTTFKAMKSPASISLREFIEKIENSLKTKLTEQDHIIVESYIHDHLISLNDKELKVVYERLAQQGTLKRLTGFNELNQSITTGLMKKIDTNGLDAVIENMKDAHLDFHSMNELIQALININHHIQTQTSVSLEQIQTQLNMAYFIETRNLSEYKIRQLSEGVDAYSVVHMPLSEEATNDDCSTFLEQLKAPFIRKCIQRILNSTNEEKTIDLSNVSSKFYNERIVDLINELIDGSDELNRNLFVHQIKEQLKKTKELPDKLYRQMLKEKLIQTETKVKVDTDKKKVRLINDGLNRILNNEKDQIKQKELIDLFDRIDIPLPERIKYWYKSKSKTLHQQSAPSKVKKNMTKQKDNVKRQIKISQSKTMSVVPKNKTERSTQKNKDRLPTNAVTTSVKRDIDQRKSLSKSRSKTQSIVHRKQRYSKSLTNNRKGQEKTKPNRRISTVSKFKDQRKTTSDTPIGQPTASPLKTEAFGIDHVPRVQVAKEDDFIGLNSVSIASPQSIEGSIEGIDAPKLKQEQIQEADHEGSSDQNIETSQNRSIGMPLNMENKVEKDLGISTQSENIDEVENDDKSSASPKTEIFQATGGIIRSETTTNGKMGENKTLNFELNQAVACFLYHSPSLNDPQQEISVKLSGKTAQFINDPPYEKTKAQRILAKALPTTTSHLHLGGDTIDTSSSSTTHPNSNSEPLPITTEPRKSSGPPVQTVNELSAEISRRALNKSLKQTEDYYIKSLTKSLHNLFSQSKYNSLKLQKIHEELIASGHISPLNEFYRSKNEALRVTLDHCVTYEEFIQWTLSLLQTTNKPNLLQFGHDLYSIAIDLDFTLTERIDNTRCAIEIQENLKHQLQTITENDLREINSYINAAQLEQVVVNIPKKLNVTSKDRMISDLNSFLLHLIQACYTFEPKYRPMQTRIREISDTFKSRAVADLARKIDEIEKHLSKTFSITLFGVSQRMNESRFLLVK